MSISVVVDGALWGLISCHHAEPRWIPITDINVRSCTIRDVNSIETLIPNSTFIEQNVTNWTYSNKRVRFSGDQHYHLCIGLYSKAGLCLYIPGTGA